MNTLVESQIPAMLLQWGPNPAIWQRAKKSMRVYQCTGVKSRTGREQMLLESWMRWDGCAWLGGNRKQGRESNWPFIKFIENVKMITNTLHHLVIHPEKNPKPFLVWLWEAPAARLERWLTTGGRARQVCVVSGNRRSQSGSETPAPHWWMLPVSALSFTEECF